MKGLVRSSVALVALLAAATHASAATRVVDDDGEARANDCSSGNDTPYTTISAALADSNPGDKIIVCSGVYNEQLSINVRVTITGKLDADDPRPPTVKPSPMGANSTSLISGGAIAAVIVVNEGGEGTVIDQLTVDAGDNGLAGCATNLIGVFFRNAGGSIKNSVVRNAILPNPADLGCQVGLGIFVQTDGATGDAIVSVTGNSVHHYAKNGITGNEIGTVLTATKNHVTGLGPTPAIAQNGIQIGWGAGGTVNDNRINDHVYSQCTPATTPCFSSTAILVFGDTGLEVPPGTLVSANTIGTSQTGVYLNADAGSVKGNIIGNTLVYDGIFIDGDGNTVTGNLITQSDESGIYVVGTGNTLTKNTINEAPVGVITTGTVPTSGSGKNIFYNVGKLVDAPAPAAASAQPKTSPVR